jgi:plastocyanin
MQQAHQLVQREERETVTMKKRISMSGVAIAGVALLAAASFAFVIPAASAEDAVTVEVSIKDHKFEPAEIKGPAGKPIVLKVKNLDAAPIEFESEPLQFETVVKPNAEVLVKVKPQKPGRYGFFDDLHQETKGALLVE